MKIDEAKAVAEMVTIAVWNASLTLTRLQKIFPNREWTYDGNRNQFRVGYPCMGPTETPGESDHGL